MTPGERLTHIMDSVGIKQTPFSQETGHSQSSINRMRKDQQDITLRVLRVLRLKYNVDVNQFFK